MAKTVIQHVLSRLHDIGIKDIFGVAGDYAFSIDDAVCADKALRWVGCCNELNAAYAADGYARMHGMAALCTTYGVGELSALNGVAGSYAEFVPIFHLVGMPASGVQAAHRLVHHTLGNGEFDLFYKMADTVVCARAIMTPENCVAETERLIETALRERRPVYLGIPSDYANLPIVETAEIAQRPTTDKANLDAAVNAAMAVLSASKTACVLPGVVVSRFGLNGLVSQLVEKSGLPFATTVMDKSTLDETLPGYIGMYDGRIMNEEVRAFVESCDCILCIGAMATDFSTGAFTAHIDRSKSIHIMPDAVRVGSAIYEHIPMKDMLTALVTRVSKKSVSAPKANGLGKPIGEPDDKITPEYLYPRWQEMLKPGDILMTETGSSSMGLAFAKMPKGSTFHNQTLWGSIGWATPAAFGAALSSPDRRVILVTGEGSHQLTAQEIGQFHRFGLKPIVFVLNNEGYLIERLLSKHPDYNYNDVAPWHYDKLPEALGCDDWFTTRVTTCGELDEAIKKAEASGKGAYIEVVTDKYAAPLPMRKVHEAVSSLYAAE